MSQHAFEQCPLRSSSLLIIHSNQQSIVSATDKVFNLLGYNPHQLIGKSIHLLNPRPCQQGFFLLQHEDQSDRLVEICMHHAIDLEYWFIKPNNTPVVDTPMTVLRLCPFGTIEHAYPSTEFPQPSSLDLQGHPIASFIYPSDVRLVCEKLKQQCNIVDTCRIRWLTKNNEFVWLSMTMIATCSTMHDPLPQTRPTICILQTIQKEPPLTVLQHLWTYTNQAIDGGKAYMVEYAAHIMTFMLNMLCDILQLKDQPVKAILSQITYPVVKVAIDNCIWSVPLLDKNSKKYKSLNSEFYVNN